MYLLYIALSFASHTYATPVLLNRSEAIVNSSVILHSDYLYFKKTLPLRGQLDPLFSGTPLAKKGPQATLEEIVEFLIDEKMITDEFPVKDADVEQEINTIQANNQISREALIKALSEQGFTFDDYFELIRISLSKRNLIDRDIRTKVHISDDDIKNYFYNQDRVQSPQSLLYEIQMITFSSSSYKTKKGASDTAKRATDALKNGESFLEVSKRFSDHPNAQTGGTLGYLSLSEMNPSLREQVKNMRVGQISGVLGGDAGNLFIIKVADIKTADKGAYEAQKDKILNELTTIEYQHQILLWLERQRTRAFVLKQGESSTKKTN